MQLAVSRGSRLADAHANRVALFRAEIYGIRTVFQEQSNLARHHIGLDLDAQRPARPLDLRDAAERQFDPLHKVCIEHVEHRIVREHVENPAGSVEIERLLLAKRQKAGDVVHIGIGQHDGLYGRVAQCSIGAWLKDRVPGDLFANVRRSVEQNPVFAVRTGGNGRLGTRLDPALARARFPAQMIVAIPLRKATAGR